MQLYNVKALVNYPEQQNVEIPDYNGVTQEGAYELLRRLLKTEPEAEKLCEVASEEGSKA